MYVNDRDQINYHGFLTALRTMHGYHLKHVSTGVCCESGMNRFEKGNRVAEKLVRDRLTARLGVSCEKYEDYLQPKEYVRWEQRMRIIKAIEKRNLKEAKRELKDYEESLKLNRTNQQFVEAMRFMILSLDKSTEEELYSCITNAVKLTVPNQKKAFAGEHLLADQEVNLILEQMYLESPKKVVRDEKAWRISEYEKLISYMENSCWEKLQKAKLYPKVAYYICCEFMSKELTETEARRGLELCHNAIELLRDSSRLYYFVELTEARSVLAARLMEYGVSKVEKAQLEEMLTENNQWKTVFKDIYAEYKVAPYMSDFCYLYYENECHNMVEVLETRRNMLGLSRSKLGEGICAEKTIIRFEREGVNPSIEVVRRLFDKMGMCAEYRRARVITTNVDALMLSNEVTRNMNNYDFERWEDNLLRLEKTLCMEIPYNRQEINRLNAMLKFRSKKIGTDDFYKLSKDSLTITIPEYVLKRGGIGFFTRSEITSLSDLALRTELEISEFCLQIINKKYSEITKCEEVDAGQICVVEFIAEELESYLGNKGKYEESNEISNRMLKECLAYRRAEVLADNIYNIVWNYQKSCLDNAIDKNYICDMLNKSIWLSKFIKSDYRIAFFQNKLHQILYTIPPFVGPS